jgi:hypothetical protein
MIHNTMYDIFIVLRVLKTLYILRILYIFYIYYLIHSLLSFLQTFGSVECRCACMHMMFVMFIIYWSFFGWPSIDSSKRKELLNTVLLHGKIRGDNVFQSLCVNLLKISVPIRINVYQSPQVALETTSEKAGLIGRY